MPIEDRDRELLSWSRRGIFPGPRESATAFLQRARLSALARTEAPLHQSLFYSLFQSAPDWIQWEWSAKHLSPWEAAATWIEESEEGTIDCRIQIHPHCKSLKDQVIAHEMVHAVRMGFEEPLFEEVLAYQTSSHAFRRYFGPLFLKGYEIKGFIALVLLSWAVFFAEQLLNCDLAAGLFLFLPIALIAGCLVRLIFLQRVFRKCLANLKEVFGNAINPLSIALRLTDAEMKQFSKAEPSAIEGYARSQCDSLRWRQIVLEFFAP